MVTDKRHARKQHKKKLLIEQQRQRVEDVSEDEAVANKDLLKKVESNFYGWKLSALTSETVFK